MKKYSNAALIAGMIGLLIFLLVFVAVIPTVATQQAAATNLSAAGANVTGASNAVLALTTLIFVAVGIITIVKYLE